MMCLASSFPWEGSLSPNCRGLDTAPAGTAAQALPNGAFEGEAPWPPRREGTHVTHLSGRDSAFLSGGPP